ncbi:MAG: GNAT family N-acetyltransferase [Caldilineaceae bacterium]
MSNAVKPLMRSLGWEDAEALLTFYNHLSPASIRTFRPLGDQTSLPVCQAIVADQWTDHGSRFDLVAWHGTMMVGWAFLFRLDGEKPELGLGVADAFHGQGIGGALLDHLLVWARRQAMPKVYLIVVTDNHRAIRLYQSRGFVIYHEQFDEKDQLPYFYMMASL